MASATQRKTRFPAPWTAVETEGGWKVVDANGTPLGYFYGREGDTDRKIYPLTPTKRAGSPRALLGSPN